ncbi:hypothetical protein P7L78_16025 [Tistrella bauzanensis]|jgi:hypothetical protein|uniref:Flagellar basal body-associated protein FliL n=1 Tax=Tistrella arctica TaxID=3133430 RepID=A0ABU9YEM0_9PROT
MRPLLIAIVTILLAVAGGGGWLLYQADPLGVLHGIRSSQPPAAALPVFIKPEPVSVPIFRNGVVYRYLVINIMLELEPGVRSDDIVPAVARMSPVFVNAAHIVASDAARFGREPTLDEIKRGLADAANAWFGRKVVRDVLVQGTNDVAAQRHAG